MKHLICTDCTFNATCTQSVASKYIKSKTWIPQIFSPWLSKYRDSLVFPYLILWKLHALYHISQAWINTKGTLFRMAMQLTWSNQTPDSASGLHMIIVLSIDAERRHISWCLEEAANGVNNFHNFLSWVKKTSLCAFGHWTSISVKHDKSS